jgi:hypothetical protein
MAFYPPGCAGKPVNSVILTMPATDTCKTETHAKYCTPGAGVEFGGDAGAGGGLGTVINSVPPPKINMLLVVALAASLVFVI